MTIVRTRISINIYIYIYIYIQYELLYYYYILYIYKYITIYNEAHIQHDQWYKLTVNDGRTKKTELKNRNKVSCMLTLTTSMLGRTKLGVNISNRIGVEMKLVSEYTTYLVHITGQNIYKHHHIYIYIYIYVYIIYINIAVFIYLVFKCIISYKLYKLCLFIF